MGQFNIERTVTLYAYTVTKKDVNLFSEISLGEVLRSIDLPQKTAKERIELLYKKGDPHPSSSRVIAYMADLPSDCFGTFYIFENVDHNIFLEQEALQKNSFTHEDLKIETDKKDDLGYKKHIYFYIKDDILITNSSSYRDLEGHLNYIMRENSACVEISLTKKIRSVEDILFSDVKELIFYDWSSDMVNKEIKAPYKPRIHKLSGDILTNFLEWFPNPFQFSNAEKRKSLINYKAYLTCEIERKANIPISEYKKELGFALRFTDEMKGNVVFKTIHNQKVEGDRVVEKKPVEVSHSPETINESELLSKMREYAAEIKDYEDTEKQVDQEGFA